jgi:hypothetical protein
MRQSDSCWSTVALMACMGSFLWAIRGTSGFGGVDGGLYAGLGWGILWFLLSDLGQRQGPLSSPWMVSAITLGIAVGGMTGYGVYISWIQGSFYLNYPLDPRPIAPWTGYAMLFVCGMHWGGMAGVLMSWCLPTSAIKWWMWLIRLGAGFAGGWCVLLLVDRCPNLFLPFYDEGIYQESQHATCRRAVNSLRNIAPHLGAFLGFLSLEVIRRNWPAVGLSILISLGFALSFAVGGYWQTFHQTGIALDWWKKWEMTIGLGGGVAIGLAFCCFNKPVSEGSFRRSPSAYIFGAGFPIWLVMMKSLTSAYQGFSNIHGLVDWAKEYRVGFTAAIVVSASAVMAVWTSSVHTLTSGKSRLSGWNLLLAFLFLFGITSFFVPYIPPLGHETPPWAGMMAQSMQQVFWLLVAVLVLGSLIFDRKRHLEKSPLSETALLFVLGLMVLLGLLVSLPSPMKMDNYVLVSLYTLLILGSSAIYLLRRSV